MSKLGPCKGINNRTEDFSLPGPSQQDPRIPVRNAGNVDFNNKGNPVRRRGITKVYDSLGSKGGFGCKIGRYFVEGLNLKKFNPDKTATTIYSGITGKVFTYDYFDGTVRFSDGIINLKIDGNDNVAFWGMQPPSPPVMATVSGDYGHGVYLAACCWVDGNGVESGASKIVSITAPGSSGFVFRNLPAPSDPQIVTLRLYLSTANGKILYHVADTTADSYTILSGRYDSGNVCKSLFLYPPPPGRIVRHYNGRYYIADEYGRVWYSEKFSFDRFMLKDSYIPFTSPVDIMEPVGSGIFFAYGEKTDFMQGGDPDEGFTVLERLDYGAVFGTGGKIPNSKNVFWQSQRGFVIGTQDGNLKNMQEDDVAVDTAMSGATLIKEQNGLRQFLATLKEPTISKLAAKSWITMETIRRGA